MIRSFIIFTIYLTFLEWFHLTRINQKRRALIAVSVLSRLRAERLRFGS